MIFGIVHMVFDFLCVKGTPAGKKYTSAAGGAGDKLQLWAKVSWWQPLLPGPSISFIRIATVILRKLGNPSYTRVGFVGMIGSPCLAIKG